jgi:hypothetical protein
MAKRRKVASDILYGLITRLPKQITTTQQCLLFNLAWFADGDENLKCWPSTAALQKRTRVVKSTFHEALSALSESGLVRREQRYKKSTVYRIDLDRLFDLSLPGIAHQTLDHKQLMQLLASTPEEPEQEPEFALEHLYGQIAEFIPHPVFRSDEKDDQLDRALVECALVVGDALRFARAVDWARDYHPEEIDYLATTPDLGEALKEILPTWIERWPELAPNTEEPS